MLNDKSNFVRYVLALFNILTQTFHLVWKLKLMSHFYIFVLAGPPIKSSSLTVLLNKSELLIMVRNNPKQ